MEFWKKRGFWARVAVCLLVTGGLLYLIFHRLRPAMVLQTFRAAHWAWFAAAVGLYGFLFLPAALRWHLVLRLTGNAVGGGPTARLTLIGHFFYTLLFGSVGGDSAKAIFYSRWYRFPLGSILATAPLDRLLGFLGMLIFSAGAFWVAEVSGGLSAAGKITISLPRWPWLAGVVVLALVVIVARARSRRESFLRGFIRAFRSGFRALVRAPRAALLGILCGWIVQASLCGVLALNLMATSQNPLPWARLGWTLPVILAISAMPVSVGGLGTREGASMFLLGLYGVPESTAVASSLLTLGVIAFWAFAGGLLFLREAARRRPAAGHVPEASIPPCH